MPRTRFSFAAVSAGLPLHTPTVGTSVVRRPDLRWIAALVSLTASALPAQEPGPSLISRDVFFLVDVSASVPQGKDQATRGKVKTMIREGRLLATRLVTGGFNATDFPDWRWDGDLLTSPLGEIVASAGKAPQMCGSGKRIIILPFGDKSVDHPAAISKPLLDFPGDFERFVEENFPSSYRDQQTYLTLARARTAALAESLQINQYYFFKITDAEQDPNSSYNAEERTMIERWESENFVHHKTRIGLFKYVGQGLGSRQFQVDVWKVDLELPPAPARILVTSPASGAEVATGDLTVEWSVAGDSGAAPTQPGGFSYFVSLLDPDSGALVQSLTVKEAHRAVLPIGTPGRYRLTVTGTRQEGGTTSLPEVLGQADVSFSVKDPPPSPKEMPLRLALGVPPLVAGEEALLTWEVESTEAGGTPPSGEFTLIAFESESGLEAVSGRTRENKWRTTFPKAGDYRLRFELRPFEAVPGLECYFFESTVSVEAKAPVPKKAKEPEPAAAPAIQFLLPRHNSTSRSKKIVFRWSTTASATTVTQYRIRVTGPERMDQPTPTSGFAHTFKKAGRYTVQVSVSAPPELAETVKPAQIAFSIEGGGGGTLWFLVIFGLGGGAGYYFWRQKKSKRPSSRR